MVQVGPHVIDAFDPKIETFVAQRQPEADSPRQSMGV
jgi:hypothetical protein